MSLRVQFHDVEHSPDLHQECERLAADLKLEFPETLRFEVMLRNDADHYETHLHVTGKEIDMAAQASSHDLRETLGEAFERARKQLRKHHDKQIFAPRRKIP